MKSLETPFDDAADTGDLESLVPDGSREHVSTDEKTREPALPSMNTKRFDYGTKVPSWAVDLRVT